MCICQLNNKTQIDVSVAEEDLTFYKVVKIKEGKLVTPFQSKEVELNNRYDIEWPAHFFLSDIYNVKTRKNPLAPWNEPRAVDDYFTELGLSVVPTVNRGAFHLFKTRDAAESFIDDSAKRFLRYSESPELKMMVIKAIVPKGTEYIDGHFPVVINDEGKETVIMYPSIAAKSVIYSEVEEEYL
jgi:hypothetical protein